MVPLLLAGFGCGGPDGSGWEDGVPVAPPCDHANVVAGVVRIATTHPDYVGGPSTSLASLADVRQVAFVGKNDPGGPPVSTRWCAATGDFGGQSETVVWDLFATETVLGVTYGIRPCFGRFHPGPSAACHAAPHDPPEVRALLP